jgi:hypothetical protein
MPTQITDLPDKETGGSNTDGRMNDIDLLINWCAEGALKERDSERSKFVGASAGRSFLGGLDSTNLSSLDEVSIWNRFWESKGILLNHNATRGSSSASSAGTGSTSQIENFPNRYYTKLSVPSNGTTATSASGHFGSMPNTPTAGAGPLHEPLGGICAPERNRVDRAQVSIEADTTTLMLRNLPNRVRSDDVLAKISSLGFEDKFDFFYMPLELKSKQHNKGYAFINLLDEKIAAEFVNRVNDTGFEGRASSKKIHVCRADVQGLIPNLRAIKHTDWLTVEHLPLVLIEGELVHTTPVAACKALRNERATWRYEGVFNTNTLLA